MSHEFELLVQEFEKFQSKIESMRAQEPDFAALRTEIESLQVSVTSPDQSITVVAGPSGSVKDIRITDEALGRGGRCRSVRRPPRPCRHASAGPSRSAVGPPARSADCGSCWTC